MKAAIVIDSYKLATFKEKLDAAGFKFEIAGKFGLEVLTLTVETDDPGKLARTVAEANHAASKLRPPKLH